MRKPVLWFRPKGGDQFNQTIIEAMSVKHSLYDAISTADITISDNGGTILAEFTMTYGSMFEIIVVDSAADEDTFKKDDSLKADPHTYEGFNPQVYMRSHDWTLVGLVDDSSKDVKAIQGSIKLVFAHPWHVFRDITNHAYAPVRIDELVKKVIKEGARGYPLNEPIDSNFDKTDDEGRVPRYKTQETDLEFIQNKLLPVTSIGFDAPYFYVDWWGDYHLKSFSKMAAEPPKVLFGPKSADIQDTTIRKHIAKLMEDNGIAEDGYLEVVERIVTVYTPEKKDDFRRELCPSFVVEDQNLAKMYAMGNRDPGTRMPGATGIYYPTMALTRQMLKGTSVKVGVNRMLGDSISSMFADGIILNECFVMEVVTTFSGQFGLPGMMAIVYVAKLDYLDLETDKHYDADHWAEGKWLIASTEHFMKKDDVTVYTRTRLIRPNLVVKDPQLTSITTLDALWTLQ